MVLLKKGKAPISKSLIFNPLQQWLAGPTWRVWALVSLLFFSAAHAGIKKDSLVSTNDLAIKMGQYTNQTMVDTLVLQFKSTFGLGSGILKNFSGPAVIIEPSPSLDSNTVINFSGTLFGFDSVRAPVTIRNLNFVASTASSYLVDGSAFAGNGSLTLESVFLKGASFSEGCITWRGVTGAKVLVKKSVFVSETGAGLFQFYGVSHIQVANSLWRTPATLSLDADSSVVIQANTFAATRLELSGSPHGSSLARLSVKDNHFFQSISASTSPILIRDVFGDFSVNQTGNGYAGYSSVAGTINEINFPVSLNPSLNGATLPDPNELWLWRIPEDTIHGGFSPTGLPNWNLRAKDSSLTIPLGDQETAKLMVEPTEIPRVLGVRYAKATYPDSLAYRTRYSKDTLIQVTGRARPKQVTLQPKTALVLSNYNPVTLYGNGFTQIAAAATSASDANTFRLPTATGLYLPVYEPKTTTTLFVSKGASRKVLVDGSQDVQIVLPTVTRAGFIHAASSPVGNVPNALRKLILAGTQAQGLVLSGDLEVSGGGTVTLTLTVDATSKPFIKDSVELWRVSGPNSPQRLDLCDAVGEGFVCSFDLPTQAGTNLGEWAATYALCERLNVPAGGAEQRMDLGNGAALLITTQKGFQLGKPNWNAVDKSLAGVKNLNGFSPLLIQTFIGKALDANATVILEWDTPDTLAKLYNFVGSQPELAKGQSRNGARISWPVSDTTFKAFLARSYTVPRQSAYAQDFGAFAISNLVSQVPSDIVGDTAIGLPDSLKGSRSSLGSAHLKGDSLDIAAGMVVTFKVAKDSLVDRIAFWQGGEWKSDSAACSDTCRWTATAFKKEWKFALLGKIPKPPLIDTVPEDSIPIPIDTTDTTDTIPNPPDTSGFDSTGLVQGKILLDTLTDGSLALKWVTPESWAPETVKAVQSVIVEKLIWNESGIPIWRVTDTLPIGAKDTLRDSGALDLGYRMTYLDSLGHAVGTPVAGLLPELSISMEKQNEVLSQTPLRRLGWHLLGWSLPTTTRSNALNQWMTHASESDKSSDSVGMKSLTSDGKWNDALPDSIRQGQGWLLAAHQTIKPQFPATVPVKVLPFVLNIKPGWNLIANPFPFPISEQGMNDTLTGLDLFQTWAIGDSANEGEWLPKDTLAPFQGYAVHSEQAMNLRLDPIKDADAGAVAVTPKFAAAKASVIAPKRLALNLRADNGQVIWMQATESLRGARYLPAPTPSRMKGWFSSEASTDAYRILPAQNLMGMKAKLTIQVPQASSLQISLANDFELPTSALLWDKHSGQAHWLKKVSSDSKPAVREAWQVPAGTWSYELWTGSAAELEQRMVQGQAKITVVTGLVLRRVGQGRGLWQLGVPAALGYASLSLAAYDVAGRMIWKRSLPAQGGGWHSLLLPATPANAWVEVQALDAIRSRATSRGGMP